MRAPRELRRGEIAVYHAISRTVAGQFLFGRREREAFRHRMRRLARFCQVQVLDYTILSNHFHLLLRVPAQVQLSDEQLLQALEHYYGPKHLKTLEFKEALEKPDSPHCQHLRAGYLKRMGDLSVYMKELKEGFTRWFNQEHERFGTLWAERFQSGYVTNAAHVITMLSAYITLNALRAGLVGDPKDYRWSGYGEALAVGEEGRAGLESFLEGEDWEEQLARYRVLLFGKGSVGKDDRQVCLDPEKVLEVYKAGGKLSVAELLRVKVRYFTEGLAVGLEEDLEQLFARGRGRRCTRRKRGSYAMEGADWGGVRVMRKIKEPYALPKKEPPPEEGA